MSKGLSLLLGGVAAFALTFSTAVAQTSVSTDAQGYSTISVNGNGGSGTAFTTLSSAFFKDPSATGGVETVGTDTLTDTDASWTPSAFAATDPEGNSRFFVEITSGSLAGNIFDITENTATELTVATGGADLSGLMSAGDSFAVRSYYTVAEIFGPANEIGLRTGGDSSSSDIIYVMSNDGLGTYTRFYYQTDSLGFLGGTGYRKAGDASTDMANLRIMPDQGLIVAREANGNLTRIVEGAVRSTTSATPLVSGFSLVGFSFPVGTTLDDSGLYTDGTSGLTGGGDSSSADIVYVMAADGTFTRYYYQIDSLGFLGGTGWRLAGDASTDVGSLTDILTAGTAVIVQRKTGDTNWNTTPPHLN